MRLSLADGAVQIVARNTFLDVDMVPPDTQAGIHWQVQLHTAHQALDMPENVGKHMIIKRSSHGFVRCGMYKTTTAPQWG